MVDAETAREAKVYRENPTVFWLEGSFHEWFQAPVALLPTGCPGCGEDPCPWRCYEYYEENGVDLYGQA